MLARQVLYQSFFGWGIFKIRSLNLFGWVGLKPPSSRSLPPEYLGLQA
jgi:hypothetical protein